MLDRMRPRLDRVQRLGERGRFTEMALGSDILAAALEGYKLLQVSGKSQGLEGLRKELGARWARASRNGESDSAETPDAPPED